MYYFNRRKSIPTPNSYGCEFLDNIFVIKVLIMTGTNNIFNTLVISKACLSLVSFLLYYYLNFREHSHYSVLSLFCILKNKWRSLLSYHSLHILNTFFNVGLSKLDIFALSFLDNGQYVSSYSIALQVPNAIKSLMNPTRKIY